MSQWQDNPPRRFRMTLTELQALRRSMEHGLRYGVYFPTTDLWVNDMGKRGTGEPKSDEHCTVEWIDEAQHSGAQTCR